MALFFPSILLRYPAASPAAGCRWLGRVRRFVLLLLTAQRKLKQREAHALELLARTAGRRDAGEGGRRGGCAGGEASKV